MAYKLSFERKSSRFMLVVIAMCSYLLKNAKKKEVFNGLKSNVLLNNRELNARISEQTTLILKSSDFVSGKPFKYDKYIFREICFLIVNFRWLNFFRPTFRTEQCILRTHTFTLSFWPINRLISLQIYAN